MLGSLFSKKYFPDRPLFHKNRIRKQRNQGKKTGEKPGRLEQMPLRRKSPLKVCPFFCVRFVRSFSCFSLVLFSPIVPCDIIGWISCDRVVGRSWNAPFLRFFCRWAPSTQFSVFWRCTCCTYRRFPRCSPAVLCRIRFFFFSWCCCSTLISDTLNDCAALGECHTGASAKHKEGLHAYSGIVLLRVSATAVVEVKGEIQHTSSGVINNS